MALPGRPERPGGLGGARSPPCIQSGATALPGRPERPGGLGGARSPPSPAMKQYVIRRVALAIPTLLLVSLIVFFMMRLMPGDVATRMVEGHAYAPTLDALRKELGLDRPAHVQYLAWIGGILTRGDFGSSYWTRQPIWDEFVRRFP